MNNSAFNFSLILMRPEYREQIDPKYKKKIEALVCCQLALPYCIVTGAHVIREDLSLCPSCNFPAIYSEFLKYRSTADICPMCTTKIDALRIMKLDSGAAVDSFRTQSSDMS
ncbi:unnamed protein product [Rotaria sp. Silwood1]|nr:unnamed protein product [Rotaria sp. Silwood1]CAF1456586.1 unnamed protein product [Rotaria sp. Silwood1]CAF1464469.1 unnamed protein product [Rotaria sp. Silwood1]